ncbi:MAG: pyrroline-5-carboxylate reductase [Lactobacillus delbrueckii]
MKVGFIGLGNMGSAIARAVAKCDDVSLLLSRHNPEKAGKLQAEIGGQLLDNAQVAAESDVVFLGIKPYQVASTIKEIGENSNNGSIWISMATGVSLETLAKLLPGHDLVRMMPNTPVAIGQGMTSYTSQSSQAKDVFKELMAHSGKVVEIQEGLMDAATAVAGCGPAFVYQFIEALGDAGVQNGLSRSQAIEMAAQTVLGSAQMVLATGQHPAQLRDAVTSPGGSTIAGVVELEKNGFRYAAISAVNAALKQNQELG